MNNSSQTISIHLFRPTAKNRHLPVGDVRQTPVQASRPRKFATRPEFRPTTRQAERDATSAGLVCRSNCRTSPLDSSSFSRKEESPRRLPRRSLPRHVIRKLSSPWRIIVSSRCIITLPWPQKSSYLREEFFVVRLDVDVYGDLWNFSKTSRSRGIFRSVVGPASITWPACENFIWILNGPTIVRR